MIVKKKCYFYKSQKFFIPTRKKNNIESLEAELVKELEVFQKIGYDCTINIFNEKMKSVMRQPLFLNKTTNTKQTFNSQKILVIIVRSWKV